MSARRLAVVGPGRVGWALARAAGGAGYTVAAIAGGTPAARASLAAATGAEDLAQVQRMADVAADIVLLTVPDREIVGLARALRGLDAALVHPAGALAASALGVPRAGSFHPLCSFAGPPRDVDLRGFGVAIDATDGELAAVLRRLAEALGMVPLDVPPESRARYHAAAVLAGNASLALLEAARRQLVALGLDADVSARVLAGLLGSVAGNVQRLGLDEALSGPIRRGDVETVTRNLDALDSGDPEAAAVYRLLGRLTLGVAARLPAAPSATERERLSEVLGGDLK